VLMVSCLDFFCGMNAAIGAVCKEGYNKKCESRVELKSDLCYGVKFTSNIIKSNKNYKKG